MKSISKDKNDINFIFLYFRKQNDSFIC